MRRLLKFLHTMGAIGLMGGMASLFVIKSFSPPPSQFAEYALIHGAMAAIATWVLFPSLGVTLVAGMLSMAANRAFHNSGWVWAKLATGVTMFEGTLVYCIGPVQTGANLSTSAAAAHPDLAALAATDYSVGSATLALFAVATANVVLGVWRPRLGRAGSATS